MKGRHWGSLASASGAFAGIGAVTWLGRDLHLNPSTVGFAFLLVVLVASLRGGIVAGSSAAIVASACYNYYFLPPLHTFAIHDSANWVALVALLVTSVTVSRLVAAAQRQASDAEQRRSELATLYALNIELFAATNRVGAIGEAAGRALILLDVQQGGLILLDEMQPEVVWWMGENKGVPPAILDRIRSERNVIELGAGDRRDLYLPLLIGGTISGVLVAFGTGTSRQTLESASYLVALAVERERFGEASAHMQALRESEALKTSLLRAVSHDLTTPLTAITIHIEALRRAASHDATMVPSVTGIGDEAARLHRRIDNLLSMARLEAGNSRARREPTPPADLFRAARENLPGVTSSRPVTTTVDPNCPDANIDPSLMLEVLINLIENAHRVSPDASTIELIASPHPDDPARLLLEVLDRGPGVPEGIADRNGNILATDTSDVAQRGLGLEIVRSLTAANGGTIAIVPRDGGGTIARIEVPAAILESPEETA
jgi:two-component system, OmpR family, sensor histidine kinase KdpD